MNFNSVLTRFIVLPAIALAPLISINPVQAATLSKVTGGTPGNAFASITSNPLAARSVADAEKAVVRIEASGRYWEPGQKAGANHVSGTGFIIDSNGTMVTNNHVVSAAASLQVYVPGEEEPRHAKLLGVSECADIAVLDIEGDGFQYLEWSKETPEVRMDVYAAGYPLGDPEYSLTDGIISKKSANGQTSWSSTSHTLEHTAKINPGNSGGPLLADDGKVVGINYAAINETDQSFALPADLAIPIIDKLRLGKNQDTIGIRGVAWQSPMDNGQNLSWVWVYSVASGSPADNAGLLPGDLLGDIEGVPVGDNGTLETYCDILRYHKSSDEMKINIVRFVDKELCDYTGEINGDVLHRTEDPCYPLEPKPDPSIEDQPTIIATVRPAALNIRKGPGTNYPVIATARQGEQLFVVGQINNCSWLGVVNRDGIVGYVAGTSQFVSLSTSCANIPPLNTQN